ncbi:MAG TPA: beta-ketoacyl-ACP synthase III [Candidatus Brocadiia bacterium]|nr:beta-ketoacyl-ACP synthase III [Candidatus Brocadiia bacterium]
MTKEYRAAIVGTGAALPDRVLTNFDLEKMVDTSDEWIHTRTGIRERRIAEKGVCTSDLAAAASRKAIEAAGLRPEDITLIIVATITPDHIFPCTAANLQTKIGAVNAGGFDLSAACSGFVYALNMAADHVKSDPKRCALVVGADILTKFIDWTDRTSCILFGDGAGAVVVRAVDDGRGLLSMEMGMDGTGASLMQIPAGGSVLPPSEETIRDRKHFVVLRGREVFKFAVTKMADLVTDALKDCGLTINDVKLIVPHQVNLRILAYAAERLGISMDKIYCNIERYGNTTAASIPIALDEAVRAGKIERNDIIVFVAFGAGLGWASCAMRW